ncbi:MAG: response regulator, partial [Leisingera sp.]
DNSTTRQYGGTGLGLSIAHRLAQQMGGHVEVDSTKGDGSCFSLQIIVPCRMPAPASKPAGKLCLSGTANPLQQIRVMAERAGYTLVENPSVPQVRVRKDSITVSRPGSISSLSKHIDLPVTHQEFLTALHDLEQNNERPQELSNALAGCEVLAVEDDRINLSVFVALVEGLGAQVRTASNGLEAVEQVADAMPDLILMDLHMPLMDGHQAYQVLKAKHGAALSPVVAASANATSQEHRRCAEAGFADFLSKPIDPARLKEVLVRLSGSGRPEAGIDKARGRFYAGGNEELFQQNLARFRQRLEEWSAQLSQPNQAQTAESIADLLHVIRGAAGTVGAGQLAQEAGLAEAGKADAKDLLPLMQALLLELNDAGPEAANDGSPVAPSIAQLVHLIKSHDVAALGAAQDLLQTCRRASHQRLGMKLIKELERLDFPAALTALEVLSEALQDERN